jgi:hypothetical protein
MTPNAELECRAGTSATDTGAVTAPYDPLLSTVRAGLEHDRLVVSRVFTDLDIDLLPAVVHDHSPGWQGVARRSFDTRREQLTAQLRRVSSSLDEIASALTAAIDGLGQTP